MSTVVVQMNMEASNILQEEDIAELQRRLAEIDLLADRKPTLPQVSELIIMKFQYTKLRMRPEQNHQRPHFHIEYKQEFSASYAIDTLECLAGNMPKKYEGPIIRWAIKKTESLQATWEKLNAGEDVRELVLVKEEKDPA